MDENTLHKTGSSAVFKIILKREGKKGKESKKKLLQHGVLAFGHPPEQDLTCWFLSPS